MIKSLKYKHKYFYAELLGKIILESIYSGNSPLPECIIPVPLHALRLLKRGFNHSELIGRYLADHLHIPLEVHCCKRIKNTQQQSDLSVKQRRKNIAGAFSVQSPLNFQHIAIVDDVVTTGSTVNELARTLKLAGVSRVEVWACARATL